MFVESSRNAARERMTDSRGDVLPAAHDGAPDTDKLDGGIALQLEHSPTRGRRSQHAEAPRVMEGALLAVDARRAMLDTAHIADVGRRIDGTIRIFRVVIHFLSCGRITRRPAVGLIFARKHEGDYRRRIIPRPADGFQLDRAAEGELQPIGAVSPARRIFECD